jgi:hypothetical protein
MRHRTKKKKNRQCTQKVILRRFRVTNFCREEVRTITYSKCVFVALGILHAKRMRCYIVICGLSGSTTFFTLSYRRYEFREKVSLSIKCVLIFSAIFFCNFSHSKKKWARVYQKYKQVFLQITRYSCQIFMKLEFSRLIFEKKHQTTNFMKTLPVGAGVFHENRWMDGWMDGRMDGWMDGWMDG